MGEQVERFDYLKVTVEEDLLPQYIDGYEKFGWSLDERVPTERSLGKATLHMRRSRHISNKVEHVRLQQHFEACMEEVRTLEASKTSVPLMASVLCGLVGCACAGGAALARAAVPQAAWLTALPAILGVLLWAVAYLSYKPAKTRRAQKVVPLIEAKYDEAYEVCEKAYRLSHE